MSNLVRMKKKEELEDILAVTGTCCSARSQKSYSQHPHGWLTTSCNCSSEKLTPSSGPNRHCSVAYTHAYG